MVLLTINWVSADITGVHSYIFARHGLYLAQHTKCEPLWIMYYCSQSSGFLSLIVLDVG
jgi:hypothetical protein